MTDNKKGIEFVQEKNLKERRQKPVPVSCFFFLRVQLDLSNQDIWRRVCLSPIYHDNGFH